jgi:hypothetical protein
MIRFSIFILTLFSWISTFSQDTLNHDNEYLLKLEIASNNLICDTIYLTYPKQTQLILQCPIVGDTSTVKRVTIFNYEASLKKLVYIRTEYFSKSKKLLAWTYKSFDTGIFVAEEINYYNSNDRLCEVFKWGSGEMGLRTKYFYSALGHLEKEVACRGDKVVLTKIY